MYSRDEIIISSVLPYWTYVVISFNYVLKEVKVSLKDTDPEIYTLFTDTVYNPISNHYNTNLAKIIINKSGSMVRELMILNKVMSQISFEAYIHKN